MRHQTRNVVVFVVASLLLGAGSATHAAAAKAGGCPADAAERYIHKPGFGSSAESGAMGEGFGDYWAASVVAQRSGCFQDVCANASFDTAANALVAAASNMGFTDAEIAAIGTVLQSRGFTVTV